MVLYICILVAGLPRLLSGKEYACNAGDLDLIPGLDRSPEGGHGNSLQYSCVEDPHGQRSLAGYSPWGHRTVEHSLVTKQQQCWLKHYLILVHSHIYEYVIVLPILN